MQQAPFVLMGTMIELCKLIRQMENFKQSDVGRVATSRHRLRLWRWGAPVARRRGPVLAACTGVVLLQGLCAPAWAQPPAGGAVGLTQAFLAALESHPSIAARLDEREAAQERLQGAQWQRYPSLTAQSSQDTGGRNVTSTRLEVPLWTGGLIQGQIDSARAQLGGSEHAVTGAQQDILVRVVNGWTELGRAGARREIAQRNVAEHERLVALIERRVASQINAPSDAIQARARLVQSRTELALTEAQADRARAVLANAMGRPVSGDAEATQLPPLPYPTLEALAHAALLFSPVLRRLRADEEAATADVGVRKAALKPRVFARYDQTHGSRDARSDRLFVGLEFQTGPGLSSQSAVREAQARLRGLAQQHEAARRDLTETLTADWTELRSLQSQLTDLRQQADATTEVYESYARQYTVGRKSWLDVLNAQRESAVAQLALADATWSATRLGLRLRILAGDISAQSLAGAGGGGRAVGAVGAVGGAAAAGTASARGVTP
jgi:outer membrane protein, adhesin transport system